MSATLKDIADDLGISINTVSHALRDMPDISQKTKERVRESASRLGYRRNLAASQLRSNRSHIIGCIVTDISNPLFSNIAESVENAREQTFIADSL